MKNQILVLFILMTSISACKQNNIKVEKETTATEVNDSHNSENSLDWSGTYRGILPCADCEGIKTEIVLNLDQTYQMNSKYLGEDDAIFQESGKFEWNENGSTIKLLNDANAVGSRQYKVAENNLIMLNTDGKTIESNLSEHYILRKAGFDQEITEKYWKLIELQGEKIPAVKEGQKEPHFILRTAENRLSGNTGCNSFMGNYQILEGNKIRFSKMGTTRMACIEIDYEGEFLEVFERVDTYRIKGDHLFLNSSEEEPLAKFEAVYFH